MAQTRMIHILGFLGTAVLCASAFTAQAAEESSEKSQPLYFFGVQSPSPDVELAAAAAARQRLTQAGLLPRPLPEGLAGLSCTGSACPQRVREAAEAKGAQVLGAFLEAAPEHDGERFSRVSMWWLDTASDKLLWRRMVVRDGQVAERVAREAIVLLEQARSGHWPASADCPVPAIATPVPQGDAAPAAVDRGALLGPVSLSIRSTAGARSPTKGLANDLQSALAQMGVRPGQVSSSGEAGRGLGAGTHLAIELQGNREDKKNTAVQSVFLSLTAPSVSRQMRLYCSPESCGRDLSRFLRVNLGALFDSAQPGPAASAPVPSAPCAPQPMPGPMLASRGSDRLVLAQAGPAPKPPIDLNPVTTGSSGVARRVCIAGSVLLAGGIAGMIPSATFYSLNGEVESQGTCFNDNKKVDCLWTTLPGSVTGMVVSGTSIALGGILLGVSYKLAGKRGSPCCRR